MPKEPAYTIEIEISSDGYLFKEVGGIQPPPRYITISSTPYPQIYYSRMSNHNTHHSLSFCFVPLIGLVPIQFPITAVANIYPLGPLFKKCMYECIKVIYIHNIYERFTNRSITNGKGKFPSYYHLDITREPLLKVWFYMKLPLLMEVWDSLMGIEIQKILRITSLRPRSTAKNGRNFLGIFIIGSISKDLVVMLEGSSIG